MLRARPYVHLNLAVRADGRVAAADGSPTRISCAEDWRRVHTLRERYDAVAVGARTWLGDRPRLTARVEALGRPALRQPARVLFAGHSEIEIQPSPDRRTILIGAHAVSGADVHLRWSRTELARSLESLLEEGVSSLLVEGGPTLLRSFLELEAFDQLTLYVASATERAVAEVPARIFADVQLPPLTASRLGAGTLLSFSRSRNGSPQARPWHLDTNLAPSLDGKLRYLELPPGATPGFLALLGPVPLPVRTGETSTIFDWYVFAPVAKRNDVPGGAVAGSALVLGDLPREIAPLVRVHSGCQTGDLFGSRRCDCGSQLERGLAVIAGEGAGLLLYLPEQEGRGIGLWAKAAAYLLQDEGDDTYEANRRLGLPADARTYAEAATVLRHFLPARALRLLSNNPAKRAALEAQGLRVVELRGLIAGHDEHNRRYLEAKARDGHRLELGATSGWTPPLPRARKLEAR